jgi:hypothetical protein
MSSQVSAIQLVETVEIIKNPDGTWTASIGMESYSGTYFSCALWLYAHSIGD